MSEFDPFISAAATAATNFANSIQRSFREDIVRQVKVLGYQFGDLALGVASGHYLREDAEWLRNSYIDAFRTRIVGFAEIGLAFLEQFLNAILEGLKTVVNQAAGFALIL